MNNFKPLLSLLLAIPCFVILKLLISSTLICIGLGVLCFLILLIATQARALPSKYNIKKYDLSSVENKQEAQLMLKNSIDKMNKIKSFVPKIKSSSVKAKIENICQLGDKIFFMLEKDPSDIHRIRRFFTYYLDTALKIIDQYMVLQQAAKTSPTVSVDTTIKKIENSLDLVIESFEMQIEKMMQNDVVDIESDIAVLESMIKSEKI